MNEKSLHKGNHIDEHFRDTELFRPLLKFGMSARLLVILRNEEITTFKQIRDRPNSEWYRVINFGKKSFEELTAFMNVSDPENKGRQDSDRSVPLNRAPIGVSLRDYFAATALQGILSNEAVRGNNGAISIF